MRGDPVRIEVEAKEPTGREPRIGHGWTENENPAPIDLPDWRRFPYPHRGWWLVYKGP